MKIERNVKLDSYTYDFYKSEIEFSRSAAQIIVPLVMDIVHPESVVDVGCGLGVWLSIFKQNGVRDILGIDGGKISKEDLKIPPESFVHSDLEHPLKIDRVFDLVVSLEVAEHISPENASVFVDSLTSLGSIILFAAAIPFQGGVHHVNEQWPEYWIELFNKKGFLAIDCLRRKVWNTPGIAYWYKQNIFLFINPSVLPQYEQLQIEIDNSNKWPFSIVHPDLFVKKATYIDVSFKAIFRPFFSAFLRTIVNRLHLNNKLQL
jgi:SAM-dependent methyltransferase